MPECRSILTELRMVCVQDADGLETLWPFLVQYSENHLLLETELFRPSIGKGYEYRGIYE